jgi:hypothetical protein
METRCGSKVLSNNSKSYYYKSKSPGCVEADDLLLLFRTRLLIRCQLLSCMYKRVLRALPSRCMQVAVGYEGALFQGNISHALPD